MVSSKNNTTVATYPGSPQSLDMAMAMAIAASGTGMGTGMGITLGELNKMLMLLNVPSSPLLWYLLLSLPLCSVNEWVRRE
jgi:hypothetical protein